MSVSSTTEFEIDLKEAEEALAEGWTLPSSWYFDPAIFEFELEHIWGHSWQLAGPRSKLEKPGDHIVCQAGGVPIVVTRDFDDRLHGFVNVCRHRGFAVALEDGSGKELLQCLYHGWTYNLDGTLREAPGSTTESDFEESQFSLLPVSVDTWGEIVLVNADPDAQPFREAHPKFEELAASRGLDPEFSDYRYYRCYTYDIDANWKAWHDNSLECYHCPTIHPTSFSAGFDVYSEVEIFEIDKIFSYRFKPTGLAEGGTKGVGYRSLQVFPGFLVLQQDHVALFAQTSPTGPESSSFVLHMYADPGSPPNVIQEWADLWNRTFLEDVEAVRIQQRALRSRTLPRGRLIRESERPVAYLQKLICESYKKGLQRANDSKGS